MTHTLMIFNHIFYLLVINVSVNCITYTSIIARHFNSICRFFIPLIVESYQKRVNINLRKLLLRVC